MLAAYRGKTVVAIMIKAGSTTLPRSSSVAIRGRTFDRIATISGKVVKVRSIFCHVKNLVCVLALLGRVAVSAAPSTAAQAERQRGWQRLAALGDGFLVWESHRGGHWRIWYRRLDGSGLRRLTPDEKGRDHFCPHISPDGRFVAYLSYPVGATGYKAIPKGKHAQLRLIDVEGKTSRILAPSARSYFEDRAVLWLDRESLIFIDGQGVTRQLNTRTGKTRRLSKEAHPEYGFLLNSRFTCGVQGRPDFQVYDPKTMTFTPTPNRGGCQPYFTGDGLWGFWMGGAGGPIKRIRLASQEIGIIINKNDDRMPKGRRYLYFPMFSRNGRLFAFGASPNRHDHFKADYDIFVAEADPQTLELRGRPVRYTFDPDCDRFPDVFLADLSLGRIRGEIPFRVSLRPQGRWQSWHWRLDGKDAGIGPAFQHQFTHSGRHVVTADKDGEHLRGEILLTPAAPPVVVSATCPDKRHVVVVFNEAVDMSKAHLQLRSGGTPVSWHVDAEGTVLTVTLPESVSGNETLELSGVTDRAQHPNLLAPKTFPVGVPTWPVVRDGLQFVWETARQTNQIVDARTGKPRRFVLKARGRAHLNHDYAMELAGGAYWVEGISPSLLAACKAGNELTVEAVVTPQDLKQNGPARMVSFSLDPGRRNMTLGQQGKFLIFRLRTPRTGVNGTQPEVRLCELKAGKPAHVVVTYRQGRLTCYRDGRRVLTSQAVKGDFRNWEPAHLIFGDEWSGERDWAGTLEGIAIYRRALTEAEILRQYQAYRAILQMRKPVPERTVKARLTARSKIPDLKKIAPYRDALAVFEYRLEGVLPARGDPKIPKTFRVAHWVILDGSPLPVQKLSVGDLVRMVLEPLEQNPQLEAFYSSDTLEEDFDMPVFYAVRVEKE